jgi:hypothetical protein
MLITKIQLSAMERVDMPESERRDFFLYVDEFQNFATESFANILSEARKYRLDLTMAHQYMEQLDETVLAAVIGNVGTIVTFRVGSTDAEILAKEFIPTFTEEDLVNLPKFHIYLKLMIDGVASKPFSALTLAPIAQATGSMEKVVRVSRERYAVSRDKIEDKIARWSGMVIIPGDEASELDIDEDEAMFATTPKTESKSAEPEVEKKSTESPVEKTLPPTPKPAPVQASQSIITPAQAQTPVVSSSLSVRPTNSASSNNQPAQPQGGQPPQFGQQSTQMGQPGSGKRKRKRKKKGGQSGQNMQNFGSPNQSAPVAIVDTEQKGISLSALQPKEVHQEERRFEPSNIATSPQISTPKTIKPNQVTKID